MDKKLRFNLRPIYRALALIAFAPSCYAGVNFLIQPNGALPTSVLAGGAVTANFTLTNLTNTARLGYVVQGFPTTVQQITSFGNCSIPINLEGHQSCNLQFSITGAVNSGFAICKGSSCTSSPVKLTVSVQNNTSSYALASGTYDNVSLTALPLLLQYNTNNGVINYPSTIISNLPTNPTYSNPDLHAVNCSGTICISAGGDDNNSFYPLVAFSTTSGNTWTYPIGSTGSWPSDFGGPGAFAAASCSGTLCIASGNYTDTNSGFPHPLLAQYQNGNWTYPITAQNPPPNFDITGAFRGTACNGSICLAVGSYNNSGDVAYPLLAQTTDGGNTWSYILDSSSTLPNNFNGAGGLNGASCYTSLCIAGGTYEDNTGLVTSYPLLAQSTDGGQNWSYAIDDTVGPQLANLSSENTTQTQFNATSCSATMCIAAGTYFNITNATQWGMVAQTTNGGALWTYAISTLPQQPADFSNNAQFTNASCDASVCIAGGFYVNQSSQQMPMLAQTTDGGATWTYVIDGTNGPQLPGYTASAAFNSTSCQNNICIAVGSYMVGQATYPMFAESKNGGAWSYVIANTVGTLPSDFGNYGVFNGSNATTVSSLTNLIKKHDWKKGYTYQSLVNGIK